MRKEFIDGCFSTAREACSWALYFVPVCGCDDYGYMCFECYDDYINFLNQQ